MIDSGSTKSFIDPQVANKFFPNSIKSDPFIVTTVFQKSSHKYSAEIPASQIFNLPETKYLKFYLFKFHNIFNGLIGLDILKFLQANINFKDGYLLTPYAKIKLFFHGTQNPVYSINVSPRSQQLIKVRTSIQNGEVIIPHTKIQNCEIPESLTMAYNGEAITTILNSTTNSIVLDLSEPIEVYKLDRNEIENIDLNLFTQNPPSTNNNTEKSPLDLYSENLPNVSNPPNDDNNSMHVEPDLDRHREIDENADDHTIHSNAENHPIFGIPIIETAVNYGANQIIINSVLHSPANPKTKILFGKKKRIILQLSQNNLEKDIIDFVKTYINPDTLYYLYFENPDLYEPFSNTLQNYFKHSALKLRKCTKKLIDVTNNDDLKEIIQNYHESKSNHRGIDETYNRIKEKYYWPFMKNSIQTFINDCEICQQSKYERHPIKIQMNITPTATKPFQILHMDTFTLEQNKFLTIIDSFSKYAQAYHLKSLCSTEIVNNLIQFFSHHGVPDQIITDNGTEFKNSVLSELLALHKIKIHFCSVNHPQSQGSIERFHSTLIEHVRLLNTRGFLKTPISHKIVYAILAYNNSLHSVTKLKPIDIINGHITENSPFNLDIDKILINDYVNDHKERSRLLYSKINENLVNEKEKRINKINETRDDPEIFNDTEEVIVKKHTRQKTANKFGKKTKLKQINTKSKTVSTDAQDKIHMDNLKRPLKKPFKFKP